MQQERRRYFRIDDDIALSFTLMDDLQKVEPDHQQMDDDTQEYHMSLEVQLRHAMVDVRAQSPKLAHVLDLMNQKINLLRSSENLHESHPTMKSANISACGMAFTWSEKLKLNQALMLNLYLQPHHELVRTKAYVAGVDANPDATDEQDAYVIRLDFVEMNKAYQEALIQHVVQRQGRQLRQRRDDEEDSE